MFPERMSYIHGDPDDMFDIYDESLAPGPAQHLVPNFATQTMQAQQFNPQLQHRSSAPGYMQMYSQSHQPMPHQNSSEHFHLPPPPSMSASNISTGIYAEPIGHSSAPGGQSSASGHVLPKSHQHSHHNHTGPPLNTTGLALTLDPTHINQHHGTPVSVNHLQPNMNNIEWNHQTSGNYAAQIDHEDVRSPFALHVLGLPFFAASHTALGRWLLPIDACGQPDIKHGQSTTSVPAKAAGVL
jgi:hypothetical protein